MVRWVWFDCSALIVVPLVGLAGSEFWFRVLVLVLVLWVWCLQCVSLFVQY